MGVKEEQRRQQVSELEAKVKTIQNLKNIAIKNEDYAEAQKLKAQLDQLEKQTADLEHQFDKSKRVSFSLMDKDGDGTISREEYENYKQRMILEVQSASKPGTSDL